MSKLFLSLLAAAFVSTAFAAAPASAKSDGIWSFDSTTSIVERRKPRVPGGSGCDDPQDIIEHPECR